MRILRVAVTSAVGVIASTAQSDTLLPFAETVAGATATTSLPGGYLLVAKPEGAFLCVLNLNDRFVAAIVSDDELQARLDAPTAGCVNTMNFKTLGK